MLVICNAAKDCDPALGSPCIDHSDYNLEMFDTAEECCSTKLGWIDTTACAAESNAGSSSNVTTVTSNIGVDGPEWNGFDQAALGFDENYLGDYETADTTEISDVYAKDGAAFVFDLGSSGSSFRRRGSVISLSEIRAIWSELASIVVENDGVVLKSIGDSLYLFFDTVADGLTATRAMYLALVARWRAKVDLSCDVADPPAWCGDESEERKRFFNTGAYGGGYGELLLIPGNGAYIDAYGAAANNAFFAGEEEAEHGECIIDEGALQQLLQEAGQGPQEDACDDEVVIWTAGDLGVDRFIVRSYGFFCYYTVCFDAECKIPDDE